MGNGTITPEELAKRLVSAKKVMNKVDTGNFEKGQINEDILSSDPMELMEKTDLSVNTLNNNVLNIDKINNSKLPDEIKRAMIEKPIVQPEISLNEGIDLKLAKRAKQLMEQDVKTQSKQVQRASSATNNSSNVSINEIAAAITPIIENTIRKVLDEKLTQILTAKDTSSLNENLVLKVGESIFSGKITGVKKSK